MVKEIERMGLPVVHACSIVPISKTVGANRIVPTIAIPHPFGDPDLARQEEIQLRKELVKKVLRALMSPIEEQTVF
ncbi:MAG: glycine reductase [Desulfobacterales bacterium SG8_35]|nr:MAG: glycine reductase [Desulfobacterales bacterium SG8_35]